MEPERKSSFVTGRRVFLIALLALTVFQFAAAFSTAMDILRVGAESEVYWTDLITWAFPVLFCLMVGIFWGRIAPAWRPVLAFMTLGIQMVAFVVFPYAEFTLELERRSVVYSGELFRAVLIAAFAGLVLIAVSIVCGCVAIARRARPARRG